ncbi:MAG: ACP S-malonyltransferase, partial [Alphaproteobacteria bacterium]|nr:ACP S-malonyltransferase [Alphaproteobacteria bacterium]
MFPGQSSRYPEMIEKLVAADARVKPILAEASDILGRDMAQHYRSDNGAVFATNRDVQIGVFLANHLHLQLLAFEGIIAKSSLGLSLGEYNHLVHIGALEFGAALKLLDQRGQLFDAGPEGAMISLFPVAAEEVEQVIRAMGLEDLAGIGLYNSPRQQVLSGNRDALATVVQRLDEESFVQAVEIESRI